MDFVVDKLIDFSSNKDEELRDISSLGWIFYLVASPVRPFNLRGFSNSPQDDYSRAPPRKSNRTESLRETVAKAPAAAHQCNFTSC
jgi:hypothetical protein